MMICNTAMRAVRSMMNTVVAPRYCFSSAGGVIRSGKVYPAAMERFLVPDEGRAYLRSGAIRVRFPFAGVRIASTATLSDADVKEKSEEQREEKGTEGGSVGGGDKNGIASYWGVQPRKVMKEDGTAWKWSCFMPWETYQADMSIYLKKYHKPTTFLDKFAYWTVKSLRWPTYMFFQWMIYLEQ